MKKLIIVFVIVLGTGIFTSCGKGDVNEEKEIERNIEEIDEENIKELVKKVSPEAKIETIIRFNEDTNRYDEFEGMGHIVMSPYISARNNDESFLERVEEFEARNICEVGGGCFVILEGREKPDYFIEKDTQQVFITKAIKFSEEDNYYVCYNFASESDFLSYCELIEEDIRYLEKSIEIYENKRYLIQGEIMEYVPDDSYILIDGIANRYDGQDYYSGKIRLNYDQEETINIVNNMISIVGFSLKEQNIEDDYWFSYKLFGTVEDSLIGWEYKCEMTQLTDKIFVLEKLTNMESESMEQSSMECLEREWYKINYSYYNEVRNCTLEVIWYDDGQVDLAFNGVVEYSFDMKEVDEDSYPGCYTYSSDNAVLIYKPGNDFITIMDDGTYEGDYMII